MAKMSMGDLGALLLVGAPEKKKDEAKVMSEEMPSDEAREMGLEAARNVLDAIRSDDADALLSALVDLNRLAGLIETAPMEAAEMEEE